VFTEVKAQMVVFFNYDIVQACFGGISIFIYAMKMEAADSGEMLVTAY
jgi:hypothetical protein